MNRFLLSWKLVLFLSLATIPFLVTQYADAKAELPKQGLNKAVFTYFGNGFGYNSDPSDAQSEAHDEVWNTIFDIATSTGYTLVYFDILAEGFDSETSTYFVSFEAHFWDGGNLEQAPWPTGF